MPKLADPQVNDRIVFEILGALYAMPRRDYVREHFTVFQGLMITIELSRVLFLRTGVCISAMHSKALQIDLGVCEDKSPS